MKRLTLIILACALAPVAGAQLYKYVDKDGKTVYSDQPPLNIESKQLNAPSSATTTGSAPKSYLERDKELEKTRAANREKAKKSDESERKAAEDQTRCAEARTIFQTYSDGGRIYKYNDKGERAFMDEQEMDVAREKARRDMEEACKKA